MNSYKQGVQAVTARRVPSGNSPHNYPNVSSTSGASKDERRKLGLLFDADVKRRLLFSERVSDQTRDQVDEEVRHMAMPSVFDVRDVLELVIDRLDDGALVSWFSVKWSFDPLALDTKSMVITRTTKAVRDPQTLA